MVWIKARNLIFFTMVAVFISNISHAQESLWKTFNSFPEQDVPSYNGGLSPFPQKQKRIEEVEFEEVSTMEQLLNLEEEPEGLTAEDQKIMLTTSILAEIKDFLSTENVFIPNLDDIIIEAIAKANGNYITLVKGKWIKKGDVITVPVDEAADVLTLLENLRTIDDQLAESVEQAVVDRTSGNSEENIQVIDILEDRVVFEDTNKEVYVINFIKAPY